MRKKSLKLFSWISFNLIWLLRASRSTFCSFHIPPRFDVCSHTVNMIKFFWCEAFLQQRKESLTPYRLNSFLIEKAPWELHAKCFGDNYGWIMKNSSKAEAWRERKAFDGNFPGLKRGVWCRVETNLQKVMNFVGNSIRHEFPCEKWQKRALISTIHTFSLFLFAVETITAS